MKNILNKSNIYVLASVIIGMFIVAILGLSIFLGKENKEIQDEGRNTDYFLGNEGSFGFKADTFGKVIDEIKKVVAKQEESFIPILTQVHIAPIAGLFATKDYSSGVDYVYFTERSAGHVLRASLKDKINTKRILHTTIPSVQESVWTEAGRGVIRRYLDDENNIVSIYNPMTAPKTDAGEDVAGVYLLNNITSIVASPNGEKIFYIINTENGVEGFISSPRGEEAQLIWSSLVRMWNVQWVNEAELLITQKPSSGIGGASFLINTKNIQEDLVISGVAGLSTLMNPSGNMVLYNKVVGGSISLFVRNMDTHTDAEIFLATLTDKCLWSREDVELVYCFVPSTVPQALYPDDWYQGLVHFSDELWKINTSTGETELLLSPEKEYNTKIDAEDPQISASAKYIFFTNRKDQSLWAVKIKEEDEEINNEEIEEEKE